MKKNIKVGIFVDGDFIPSYDGASNRFHYLSRYLSKNGIEVVIFHGYRGWSDISLIRQEPFKTYIFPIESYYNNLELIAYLINKEGIDIIQFDNLEPIILQGVALSRLTNTKLVSEMHYVVRNLAKKLGANPIRLKEIEDLERAVGSSVDHLISLSYHDKPFIEKYLNLDASKISIIPSGVDCEEIKYFGPNFDKKNIIFLGNLFFKPNEDAVRILRNQVYPKLLIHGFRFTIAGDCPQSLKEELSGSGFIFIGTIPDLNILFSDATFAVAPIDEGTGMRIKFLNFLAAGIPILTTNIATNGFEMNECFFIEDDYTRYADKLLDILNNRKFVIKVSKMGRSKILKKYDWNIIASTTAKVYKKILKMNTRKLLSQEIVLLKNKEPVWLQEAIEKKRFKQIPAKDLPSKFSYVIVNNNQIEPYSVNKIIALEGMPGAGKTTFINNHFNSNLGDKIFLPQLQICNQKILDKDNIETSKCFLLAEKDKTVSIDNLSKKNSEIIIDRTFITTMAYCYARSKVNNNLKEYKRLFDFYLRNKKDITIPTHLIILDVSVEESLERRSVFSRDAKYHNWFDKIFLGYFKDFYKNAIRDIVTLEPYYIDTSGMNLEDVTMKINDILCKIHNL